MYAMLNVVEKYCYNIVYLGWNCDIQGGFVISRGEL